MEIINMHMLKKGQDRQPERMANLRKAVIQVAILLSGPSCFSSGTHRIDKKSLRGLGLDTGHEGKQVRDDAALSLTELMLYLAAYMTMQY